VRSAENIFFSFFSLTEMNTIFKISSVKNLKMYIINGYAKILKIIWENSRKLQHRML
jgi:hypothetical protein